MSDYPLFIPEFMLYMKSSLLWFKITTKLREFRNYLSYYKNDTVNLFIFLGRYFKRFRTLFARYDKIKSLENNWRNYHIWIRCFCQS